METQNNPVKSSQSESNGKTQKGNTFLIIAIIVGIIAIGAVGFVLGKYYSGSELEENGSKITKPLEEEEDLSSKASATEDWKTYQNKEYGYEIKCPEDWNSSKHHDILMGFTKNKAIINIGIENLEAQSIKEICDKRISNSKKIIQPQKEIYINGEKGCEIIGTFCTRICTGSPEDIFTPFSIIYIIYNDKVYKIEYTEWKDIKDWEYYDTFKKIVSTFKIIETDKTADWKTYQNTKYGYEIKYPSETQIVEDEKEYVRFFLPPKPRVSAPVDILICDNPKKLSVKEFMMEKDGDLPLKYIETILIDNTEAVKYYADGGGVSPYTVLIAKGKLIYRLDSYRGFDELFNQILSTFKFTD